MPYRGLTIDQTARLVVEECPTCSVLHAIPDTMRERALGNPGPGGRQIYCPNGHSWHFVGLSPETKLRRKLANTEESLRIAQADAEMERRSAAAYKGHITRLKNRVGKGKCPACSAEFPNIAEHMAHEHPGYGDD